MSDNPSRVLVLGDDFMPTSVFATALAAIAEPVSVHYVQLEARDAYVPATDSERGIREFFGDPAQVRAALDGHTIVLFHGAPITAEVLDAAPELAFIGCARGGPVNVDIEAATARRIAVVNTPGKNAAAVADLTLAFVLHLARGLTRAAESLRGPGRLTDSTFGGADFFGRELEGQTLGLVGIGYVGRLVAARVLALGMRVVAYDPYVDTAQCPTEVRMVELDELLGSSDFVSLHARANGDNRHLIDASRLKKMKSSAYLINTARESLVDEAALLAALDDGVIAGAAVDVLESPSSGRHAFVDRPDVLVTPHIGGATHETLRRGAEMLVADVARHIRGEPLLNLVNPIPAAVSSEA
ncbi:MAG: NAD(P)-dependent oxidoreductase [Actinomycetota bacterium]